jgi:hypothetical protein
MTINLLQVSIVKSVSTRVGKIGMFGKDRVLEFADSHIPPGENVFFYPYRPMYYFLSGATNPTRFSILVYNYNTRPEFDEVVRDLDTHLVRYVVWDTNFEKKVFPAVFPGVRKVPADQEVIEPYLNSNYTLVTDLDGYRIMTRKTSASVAIPKPGN